MLLAALSLALVANSYDPPRSATPRAERVALATVTIISGEEVTPLRDPLRDRAEDRGKTRRATARQNRVRDGIPMVEFY